MSDPTLRTAGGTPRTRPLPKPTSARTLDDPGVSHTVGDSKQAHPKEKKPRKTGVKRTGALAVHEQEFVHQVIKPKLLELLHLGDWSLDITKLTASYNTAFNTSFSPSTIKKWTDILGWKCERVARWTGITIEAHQPDLGGVPLDPSTMFDRGLPGGPLTPPTPVGPVVASPFGSMAPG